MFTLNTCSFQKKYIHNRLYKFKEVKVELSLFSRKCSAKYNFLGIYKTFNITNNTNLNCKM